MPRIRLSTPRLAAAAGMLGLIAASLWLRAQSTDTRPLSELLPPRALLYLEAKDFHGILNDWNSSGVKSRWLKSANHSVLTESRLVLRLSQAQDEFAQLTGMPIGMSFADQAAGTRSGLAFYDFSALRFVYLSQISESALNGMRLWREKTTYTRREVSGIPFYLKTSQDGTRTVAFASYQNWFVLATDQNLAAETLVLLSGHKNASLATEDWFQAATKQAPAPGDLRLVYNLKALIATPQFRTYWLHRNASELSPFNAGISDLFRQSDGWKEERFLLRKNEESAAAADESLRDVLPYAPSSASLYRAWSTPDRDTLIETLQSLIAPEEPQTAVFEPPAPEVTAEAADVGAESDLETRIDAPPVQHAAKLSITPVVDAIMAMQPTALLSVQASRALGNQVFIMPSSGAVIVCKQIDGDAVNRALAQLRQPLDSGLIDPLTISIQGHAIVLSRLKLAQHSNVALPVPANARYIAVYNHAAEWPHYKKLFGILDQTPSGPEGPMTPNGRPFFSGNLESIGESLPRLAKASIVSSETGAIVHETLKYEFARP